MHFAVYRQLLKRRPLRNLLLVTIVAKLPTSAAGLLLTFHVVQTLHYGYAAAGAVVALLAIGVSVGAPWLGRLVDTFGLRKALIPSIVVEAAVWSVTPHLEFAGLLVAVLAGGVFALPMYSLGRQSLGAMATAAQRQAAYALDSIGTEVTWMVGPAAAALVAVHLSTVVGLTAVGLCGALAGLALVWMNPPTHSAQSMQEPHDAQSEDNMALLDSSEGVVPAEVVGGRTLGASGFQFGPNAGLGRRGQVNLGISTILLVTVVAGLIFGGTNVGIMAILDDVGQSHQAGLVFIAWGLASLLGGLVYGAMTRGVHPPVLVLFLAALTALMGMASDVWNLSLLLIPAGLLCAPTLIALAQSMAEFVDENRRGEALGWYGSALSVGSMLGSPLMGLLIDAAGPRTGFACLGSAGAALCTVGLVAWTIRRQRTGPSPVVTK